VRALVLGYSGDHRGSAAAAAQAAEECRAAGLSGQTAVNLHQEGEAWLFARDLARAYARLQAARTLAEELGAERLANACSLKLAFLDAKRGASGADRLLGEAITRAETQRWTLDALRGRYLLGLLLKERGDAVGARRELSLVQERAKATGNGPLALDCARELGQSAR
jgi:eukaryotic-like serine/threonine-protein kinase